MHAHTHICKQNYSNPNHMSHLPHPLTITQKLFPLCIATERCWRRYAPLPSPIQYIASPCSPSLSERPTILSQLLTNSQWPQVWSNTQAPSGSTWLIYYSSSARSGTFQHLACSDNTGKGSLKKSPNMFVIVILVFFLCFRYRHFERRAKLLHTIIHSKLQHGPIFKDFKMYVCWS